MRSIRTGLPGHHSRTKIMQSSAVTLRSMEDDPLLRQQEAPIVGAADFRGRPVRRSATGRWTAAVFIIGVEVSERFAYCAIEANLITYLTGPLGESTASAAINVNVWSGMATVLPLLGAFVADSYLGRYRTIAVASVVYVLGLAMLTVSAVLPTVLASNCSDTRNVSISSPTHLQVMTFYTSLYLVAAAQGGHKPCVQAFGADQFDQNDPDELKSKSSFFNWWYFGVCASTGISTIVMSYVQDNLGWGLGFGIPCIIMGLGLIVFLLGTRTYRLYVLGDENPFARIARALTTLIKSRYAHSPVASKQVINKAPLPFPVGHNPQLDRLLDTSDAYINMEVNASIASQIEEAKEVLRLFPIWATCLIYGAVSAQMTTFFTKQGRTLDRRIGSSFEVPPAALQAFISIAIVAFIPIYDLIIVPVARKFSGSPSGLTVLQRIGTGLALSIILMVDAALVEIRRLKIAQNAGLLDKPEATLPMSFWWLVPQYVLFGIANVFTLVGLQEFFYDQVPRPLRSLGIALYLSIMGVGSFLSGFLVSLVDVVTRGGDSWFLDNLNRAHVDYFYWLLAGLSMVGFTIFLYCAQSYIYKKNSDTEL